MLTVPARGAVWVSCFSAAALVRGHARRGMSTPDVLMLVGALMVLGFLALPVHSRVHDRSQRAACLANLGRIGAASHTYAAEDLHQQLIALHRMEVLADHGAGFLGTRWGWRTALPRAYGGVTPTVPMPTSAGDVLVILDESQWGNRPLNPYVGGDVADVFRCPADSGYPAVDPEVWGTGTLDAPAEAADMPCFDYLGNSYRRNTTGLLVMSSPSVAGTRVETGPGAHPAWNIAQPAETVLYADSRFLWWARNAYDHTPEPKQAEYTGWHGEFAADHVAFVDGSARLTAIGQYHYFSEEELEAMGFDGSYASQWDYFLRRGDGWQADCYPAPAALLITYSTPDCVPMGGPPGGEPSGWPLEGYTMTDPPCVPAGAGEVDAGGAP